MRRLRFLIQIYAMIMSGVTMATALFITVINPTEMVESALLWQMMLVSGLCALTSLIYPWSREMGKTEAIVKTVIHYILINVIVLGGGALFYWYDPSEFHNIAAMVLTIAIIFAAITASSWKRAALDAARMNKRLEEYQKKEKMSSGMALDEERNDLENSY